MYAVGLEGGGSTTKIAIIDLQQRKLLKTYQYSLSSNRYAVGLQSALNNMHRCISDALTAYNIDIQHVSSFGFTVSGFNAQDPQILNFMTQLNPAYASMRATHDTDGPASYYHSQNVQNVSVLIAGTGSGCKTFFNGKQKMLSAFGHELNEDGCAYSCVRRFVNQVLKAKDLENHEFDGEWRSFAKFMEIEEDYRSGTLLDLFYGGKKLQIAGFAQYIFEHRHESKIFMETLKTEAKCVADVVSMIENQFRNVQKLTGTVNIVKVGSFWKILEDVEIHQEFLNIVKDYDMKLIDCEEDAAVVGAAIDGLDIVLV
ncbi:N-acetylglucosamine_kinase [Hexamita inflata]|uniref:N-acetyl-D-glucosamine kinase n=1 Tax=Hexamita inflata TaxID=28002 RepID=A0ABP1GG95_9EUKA